MIIFTYIYIHTYIYYDIIKLSLMIIYTNEKMFETTNQVDINQHIGIGFHRKNGAEINQKNHRSKKRCGIP